MKLSAKYVNLLFINKVNIFQKTYVNPYFTAVEVLDEDTSLKTNFSKTNQKFECIAW